MASDLQSDKNIQTLYLLLQFSKNCNADNKAPMSSLKNKEKARAIRTSCFIVL